jgi:hypothetical protein
MKIELQENEEISLVIENEGNFSWINVRQTQIDNEHIYSKFLAATTAAHKQIFVIQKNNFVKMFVFEQELNVKKEYLDGFESGKIVYTNSKLYD